MGLGRKSRPRSPRLRHFSVSPHRLHQESLRRGAAPGGGTDTEGSGQACAPWKLVPFPRHPPTTHRRGRIPSPSKDERIKAGQGTPPLGELNSKRPHTPSPKRSHSFNRHVRGPPGEGGPGGKGKRVSAATATREAAKWKCLTEVEQARPACGPQWGREAGGHRCRCRWDSPRPCPCASPWGPGACHLSTWGGRWHPCLGRRRGTLSRVHRPPGRRAWTALSHLLYLCMTPVGLTRFPKPCQGTLAGTCVDTKQ